MFEVTIGLRKGHIYSKVLNNVPKKCHAIKNAAFYVDFITKNFPGDKMHI
jgi:hypothetical protein